MKEAASNLIDQREALFNGGEVGAITDIQLSKVEVTSIRGIMIDLDPHLLHPKLINRTGGHDGFVDAVVRWCENHPVLQKSEIRMTGNGVHVLLWIDEPVVVETSSDQDRWDDLIKTVQGSLPSDPAQPSITACTRPVGSTNSKNNSKVRCLRSGAKVSEEDVLSLATSMQEKPLETICSILFGDKQITPCPLCESNQSAMTAFGKIARCYNCKRISLKQFLEQAVYLNPNSSEVAQ